MDYCRKAHCLLPHGKLDGPCTQERYTHEPLPFQWPSRTSVWQVLTLVQTYVSHSRWLHGTASRSFAPLQTSFFHWHPLTVCLMRRSRSAIVSDSSCLKSARYRRLWNAKMKLIVRSSSRKRPIPVVPTLRSLTVSSRVSQQLYASSPPATSMRAHCLSSGIWSATKITFHSPLQDSSKRLPCLLLSSSSPDTSPLAPTAWFLQLDGPFRTTKENWMRWYLSNNWR